MSLLSCEFKWEEEARFEQTRREWRAFYIVLMSDVNDGPAEILKGTPKLAPYQQHPKDGQAYVAEWTPKRIPGGNWWDLEVRYSTEVEQLGNPLTMPADITIESNLRDVPAMFDIDGNPIVNTAGDLFTDPPPTRKVVDQVIKVSKNIGLNLPSWIQTHPGSVNADAIRVRGLIYPPGTLFFGPHAVGPENNIPGQGNTLSTLQSPPYTTVEWEMWYREEGWTELYPNRGYFEIVPVKKQTQTPEDAKAGKVRVKFPTFQYVRRRITIGPLGDYPPEPVFLDANGAAIINPTFDNIIILEYDGNKKRPFNVLPLK